MRWSKNNSVFIVPKFSLSKQSELCCEREWLNHWKEWCFSMYHICRNVYQFWISIVLVMGIPYTLQIMFKFVEIKKQTNKHLPWVHCSSTTYTKMFRRPLLSSVFRQRNQKIIYPFVKFTLFSGHRDRSSNSWVLEVKEISSNFRVWSTLVVLQ